MSPLVLCKGKTEAKLLSAGKTKLEDNSCYGFVSYLLVMLYVSVGLDVMKNSWTRSM